MTQQEMDRMNDSLQDQMLAAYEQQQKREHESVANEEPPYDEDAEMQERIDANPAHYS